MKTHSIRATGALALALLSAGLPALAETPQEAQVRRLVQPHVMDKIDSVTKTPYLGLFEVRMGHEILYTDAAVTYLFNGNIINAKTSQDYTKMRQEEISRIRFEDLPLQMAFKQVKGNGKRVIAVFEDPNCGYCKRLRETLQSLDNVTIYTFMYNILSPESVTTSRDIWCTADRAKAWDDWMLNGKAAPAAAAGCKAPHEQVLAFGQKQRINGTPTIFFADGSRLPGAADAKQLEQRMAAAAGGPRQP